MIKFVKAGALTLSAITAVALLPTAAEAASPQSLCGAGYTIVKDGSRAIKTKSGEQLGVTYVLYSGRTGKNCAVTIKTKYVGKPSYTYVRLEVKKGPWDSDSGDFTRYAGPVYVSARHKCVSYWGNVSSPDGKKSAYGGRTKFDNCG
ncbi:hypothetical protein [Microtetraspora fusca]|uniref:hypothetical protein n=1 Tax=Microtetraspora fusca TaxID=1997 RepID=UPI00082E1371|nr:hypothetical protein [Microtetraspora fusca]